MIKLPLTGVIPPMVTPLQARDKLDAAGLGRLIEHILEGGVSGLFLLGTTGEGPSLSYRLKRELVRAVCQQVNRRVPVLVSITDTSFVESVNLARFSAENGASALVLAAPYYLPPGQSELIDYLACITGELPLPLFLYNFPALTKVEMGQEVLIRAMQNPHIVGLKDSSADLACLKMALGLKERYRPDWTVLVGPEELLSDAVEMGAQGGIPGGANLFPRLYTGLYEAAKNGDKASVTVLKRQVMRVSEALYHLDHGVSGIIKGLKCALRCAGLCDDFMADPFYRFCEGEHLRVGREVAALGELIENALGKAAV